MAKEKPKFQTKEVPQTKPKEEKPVFSVAIDNFIGKTIEVSNLVGDKVRGKCIAISKNHLNVIVETEEDIIIIKNISGIKRNKK